MIPAPWTHQQAGFDFVEQLWRQGHHGAMLAMVMGSGKSRVAIELAGQRGIDAKMILILAPLRVIEVWRAQFEKFAPGQWRFAALDDRVKSVADKKRQAQEAIEWSKKHGKPAIIAVNYDSARMAPFDSWALNQIWDLIVLDECLPAGTPISTPHGERNIEDLRPGDIVLGYDHSQNQIVETTVQHAFQGQNTGPRFSIGATAMTSGHPVWTQNGYTPACKLKEGDYVSYLDAPLRMVRLNFHQRPTNSFLQQEVLSAMANVAPRVRENAGYRTTTTDQPRKDEKTARATRSASQTRSAFSQRPESRQEPGKPPESNRETARDGLSHINGRQWRRTDYPAKNDLRRAAASSVGICNQNRDQTSRDQSRSGDSRLTVSYRGRWPIAQSSAQKRRRPQKGKNPPRARMDSVAFLERGSPSRSALGYTPHPDDPRVFNIETGTRNYFANGLLVHNSHKIKQPGGRTSRFAAQLGLRAKYRLALTGTPMAHEPIDIWAQFRFLDPSLLDPAFSTFKWRYAVMGGYFRKEIVGWRNLDQLERDFKKIAFRVDSSVLDLPPEMDQTLSCDLSEEGARIYAQMEREMIAWLKDGREVTAANAMVKLLRLQQITGGSLPNESGISDGFIDYSKQLLLQDLLEDLDEPVVAFARFRADLFAIHAAANNIGKQSAELSGRRDDLASWHKPDGPKILAVQMQAGGVGVDLSRARVAIYYSIGFSLADYLQSRARIRRPPQTRPCVFYHLQVRNSVDEYVLKAVLAREELIDSVLKDLKQKGARNVVAQS